MWMLCVSLVAKSIDPIRHGLSLYGSYRLDVGIQPVSVVPKVETCTMYINVQYSAWSMVNKEYNIIPPQFSWRLPYCSLYNCGSTSRFWVTCWVCVEQVTSGLSNAQTYQCLFVRIAYYILLLYDVIWYTYIYIYIYITRYIYIYTHT